MDKRSKPQGLRACLWFWKERPGFVSQPPQIFWLAKILKNCVRQVCGEGWEV